jgi:hypothetical protein
MLLNTNPHLTMSANTFQPVPLALETHSAANPAAQYPALAKRAAKTVAIFDLPEAEIAKATNLVYAALVEMQNTEERFCDLLVELNDMKQAV